MHATSNIGVVFLTAVTLITSPVQSANIVFYFGVSSYSHRIPAWPLAEALADQGHNVTFISPFPSKSPNPKINDYVPTKLKEWVENWDDIEDVYQDRKMGQVINGWIMLPEFGRMACDVIYSDNGFLKWVKETKVDLVFIDSLFNDCAYGMVHHWNAKFIIFGTSTTFPWYTESYGLPDESNWIPDMILYYPAKMTFTQRMKNALMSVAWDLFRRWKYFPDLEQVTREKLGITNLPKFEDIERNASMVFINTHYSEEFARSLSPNVIPVGGIAWVEKRKPLPKDLDKFLSKGSGFIYLSFGTYADFMRMDATAQQAIIGAIRSFPHVQFVWKVGNDSLVHEFPDGNVYINKWMPQQDILAHPKVKAFITHSGLLGIQEAVYNAVPLISFPIFAEQDYNAERIHRNEYGIRLEITTVKQAELEDAINRILTDPKYRNNMQTVSTMFKERPQKPLDTALWWTDFVLRHTEDELARLRPLTVGQSWWVKRQLDVWAIILGTVFVALSICLYIILKVLKYLCCAKSINNQLNKFSHKKIQ